MDSGQGGNRPQRPSGGHDGPLGPQVIPDHAVIAALRARYPRNDADWDLVWGQTSESQKAQMIDQERRVHAVLMVAMADG